jgi:hypothetical protein
MVTTNHHASRHEVLGQRGNEIGWLQVRVDQVDSMFAAKSYQGKYSSQHSP